MGDRIMSRPLDPGADANWDNTFGTKTRQPTQAEVWQTPKEPPVTATGIGRPTYEELAASLRSCHMAAGHLRCGFAMTPTVDAVIDETAELLKRLP